MNRNKTITRVRQACCIFSFLSFHLPFHLPFFFFLSFFLSFFLAFFLSFSLSFFLPFFFMLALPMQENFQLLTTFYGLYFSQYCTLLFFTYSSRYVVEVLTHILLTHCTRAQLTTTCVASQDIIKIITTCFHDHDIPSRIQTWVQARLLILEVSTAVLDYSATMAGSFIFLPSFFYFFFIFFGPKFCFSTVRHTQQLHFRTSERSKNEVKSEN